MWQKLTQLNIAASLVAQCWHYSMRGNYQLHTNLIGTKNKYVPTSYLLKNVLQTCYLVLVATIIMAQIIWSTRRLVKVLLGTQ